MLKKQRTYQKAYEITRRDLEETIQEQYGINDFAFGIDEIDGEDHLTIDAGDIATLIHAGVMPFGDIPADRFDRSDFACGLISLVTGDNLSGVIIRDEGPTVLCLV